MHPHLSMVYTTLTLNLNFSNREPSITRAIPTVKMKFFNHDRIFMFDTSKEPP